ncbi:zinc finger BED domain-containing protein 1-like protein, partial [Aphelenchoides avenae]
RAAVESVILSNRDYPTIEAGEWMLMKQLTNVLEPLKLATVAIQDRKAHIRLVLPAYFTLQKLLRGGDRTLQNVKKAILLGLDHRMTGWRYHDAMLMATVFDPRFKLEVFGNAVQEEVKEKLKQYVVQEAAKILRLVA